MYSIPFTLVIYLVACFFIGMYFDSLFKTDTPVFTMLFTLLGLISGIWSAIKKTMK